MVPAGTAPTAAARLSEGRAKDFRRLCRILKAMEQQSVYAHDVHLAAREERVILCEYVPSRLDGDDKGLLQWTSPESGATYLVHDLNAHSSCVIATPSSSHRTPILESYKELGRESEHTHVTYIRPASLLFRDDFGDEPHVESIVCSDEEDYDHLLDILCDLKDQADSREKLLRALGTNWWEQLLRKPGSATWREVEDKCRRGELEGGVPERKIVILNEMDPFLSRARSHHVKKAYDCIRALIHRARPVGIHLVVVSSGSPELAELTSRDPHGVWVSTPFSQLDSFSRSPREKMDRAEVSRPEDLFRVEVAPLRTSTALGRVPSPTHAAD